MNILYIISSGAGGVEHITPEAHRALKECEVVVAYTKYAKELEGFLEDKEIYTSGMTQEIERCNQAIESAKSGKTTCIISNGDANVFGMATLVVELMDEKNLWGEIELISIPGVTTFLAAASKVGAPISQDFAVISLSDRLTDIELINKRVKVALECDFVIGIYNPKSSKRVLPYQNFLARLSEVDTRIAIIAQDVGREQEEIIITSTKELIEQNIDHPNIGMNSIIIICNSSSRLTKNGLVLTPRGYLVKYDIDGEKRE